MKKILIFALAGAAALAAVLFSCDTGNGGDVITYPATVTVEGSGTASANPQPAEAGATVTLSAIPTEGHVFTHWTVTGGDVTLSSATANPATFTMPAAEVSVTATFTVVMEGIEINGVTWATSNIHAPGAFTTSPDSYGLLYQFNRRTGWSTNLRTALTSTPVGVSWSATAYTATEWEAGNDPCPAGWRVPTTEEFGKLNDKSKVTSKHADYIVEGDSGDDGGGMTPFAIGSGTTTGVGGRYFTDNTTGKSIFLPFAGLRGGSSGTLLNQEGAAYFWAGTITDGKASYMIFDEVSVVTNTTDILPQAFSIRCVKR